MMGREYREVGGRGGEGNTFSTIITLSFPEPVCFNGDLHKCENNKVFSELASP